MRRPFLLFFVGTLLPGGPLHAQAVEQPDEGLWIEASLGAAGARLTCDICDPSRDRGPTLGLAVGTRAGEATRVGLDVGGFTFRDGDFRESVLTAGIHAAVYPRQRSGLHLIGGLGWSGYRAGDVDADPEDEGFRYDALRLRLGLGWDFPLTRGWDVGNQLLLDASSLGKLNDDGTPVAESVGLSVVRFSVHLRRR